MRRIGLLAMIAALAGGCSAPPQLMGNGADFAAMLARANATALMGQLAVDGVVNGEMTPGKPATWTFTFSQGGVPMRAFDQHHDREMHLVIVRQDLSSFAHIHPKLGADGTFSIRVGARSTDADDGDALKAVSQPGPYFVFAEVTPKGQPTTVVRFTVNAQGTMLPMAVVPDRFGEKYLTAEGAPGREGDRYRVGFNLDRSDPSMPTLDVTVAERQANGQYVGVTNLEPWLGMPGHSIWVSAKGNQVGEKVFVHAHAMGDMGMDHMMMGHPMAMGAAGPKLSFMLMGDEVPPAGTYKVWVQFKHRRRVMTVPYVLTL